LGTILTVVLLFSVQKRKHENINCCVIILIVVLLVSVPFKETTEYMKMF